MSKVVINASAMAAALSALAVAFCLTGTLAQAQAHPNVIYPRSCHKVANPLPVSCANGYREYQSLSGWGYVCVDNNWNNTGTRFPRVSCSGTISARESCDTLRSTKTGVCFGADSR